ncbi:MAG TPA: AAA family ATPase [Flavobacterium sp.]|uniref:AAA family ATPase n=1 Tax=Flavobacterium sp. TaxID=239 RepID=UPI002CE68D5B|nr:AAA family ATPase [Flavobacterium sp.]HSD13964.1 AAA family ATPase [Flavobacterium sp.]
MVKAFVFGKFLPFHKGHEAMIKFALTKCDFLTVLICCSDRENIPAKTRQNWIQKTFETNKKIEIRIYNYLESELPNTSESSKEVSKVWSEKFKAFFPDYDLVITSEAYGNYVASFMKIEHIAFDIPKQQFPVSATAVRKDLFTNWKFLPNSVKPDFAIKVVVLGTESTGKTTLTEKLAQYFNCSSVKEAGRDLIANSNSFEFDDLHNVAIEQAKKIDTAVLEQSPLVIIDTDIHITKSYANYLFDKKLEVDNKIYNSNKADLYLYLNNDVEYVQDGTRLNETDRNLLDLSHREILKLHNIDFIEINGNWEQRFEKAVAIINRLIKKNNRKYLK